MKSKEKRMHGINVFVFICVLFCILYFTSYMTRKSFSAIKLGLPGDFLGETEVGLIGGALFFAYGIGQIISGLLGDRIDPRWVIFGGLTLTTVCNLLFPVVTSVPLLVVLWAVNGFAQALFWPPIVKLLTIYLEGDQYTKAITWAIMGSNIALVSVYLLATLIINRNAWKPIFYAVSGIAVAVGVLVAFGFRYLERKFPGRVRDAMKLRTAQSLPEESAAEASGTATGEMKLIPLILASGLLFVFVMTATTGFLRDGIEEWMSTYIRDVFSLKADFSTFLNVFMPLFGLLCVKLTEVLLRRVFHDEIREVLALEVIVFSATALLGIFFRANVWLSMAMIVLTIGCVHAVNTVLTSFLPARFVKTGKVATVSGLTNAFTYVGSTAATSLTPWVFGEGEGWQTVIFLWAGAALLCILATLLIRRRWNRFTRM